MEFSALNKSIINAYYISGIYSSNHEEVGQKPNPGQFCSSAESSE